GRREEAGRCRRRRIRTAGCDSSRCAVGRSRMAARELRRRPPCAGRDRRHRATSIPYRRAESPPAEPGASGAGAGRESAGVETGCRSSDPIVAKRRKGCALTPAPLPAPPALSPGEGRKAKGKAFALFLLVSPLPAGAWGELGEGPGVRAPAL